MPPGTQLKNNRYRIKQFLTAGGFGAIYVAEDTVLSGRLCVLKESFDQTPEGRAQFEIEAATLSTLNHPHLVRVTDNFVEPNQKMYLAMEYIEGEDLEDVLKRAPAGLPEKQVLEWMDQVLDAVAYCHTFNPKVVHRDIKPTNIRIRKSDGQAVVVDFGIAKIGGKTVRTRLAARGYSPGYSPPEQYGTGTDTYSDVYALGATLYHLLTGRVPPASVDIAHSGAVLVPSRSLRPNISPETEQVILTAMQLLPQNRYQTAGDMRLVLQGKQPTLPVGVTCPHCGAPARAGARFCQTCGRSLAPVKPLVFRRSGHSARTVAELVHGCDSFWDEGRDLFWRGEFEPWLNSLGEPALAQSARTARARHSDSSAALEEFLEVAAPTRSKPILTIRPDPLDFGRLYKGDTRVLDLTIANTGRGYLHGKVTVDPPAWLSAHPTGFGCLAGVQQPIQVEVNTAGLSGDELGTEYGGKVTVQSNRGAQTIPVRLAVVDPPDTAVAPDRLDFGSVPFGAQVNRTLSLRNQGGGTLRAVVRTLDDWLVLLNPAGQPLGSTTSPAFALKRGHSSVVNLVLDSGRLPTRGQHTGALQIEAANARTPVVSVPVTVTVDLPYLLDPTNPASAIRDKEDFWRWCDEDWAAALGHLRDGRLEACLRFIGEAGLAQEAMRCRQMADPKVSVRLDLNVGLETLLRACGAPAPKKWETNALDIEGDLGYGFLPKLGKKPEKLTFQILNKSSRGYLHGYLDPVASWLSIPEPHFGCRPGEIAEVEIHVNREARPRKFFSPGEQLFDIVIE
jgi:serine/threonine-protein kinase